MKLLFTEGTIGFEHGKKTLFNGSSVFQLDWMFGKTPSKKAEPTASTISSSAIGPFLAGIGISFAGFLIATITNKKEVK